MSSRRLFYMSIILCFAYSGILSAEDDIKKQLQELQNRIQTLEKDNRDLKEKVDSLQSQDEPRRDIEAEVDELLQEDSVFNDNSNFSDSNAPNAPIISYNLGGGASLQLLDLSFDTLVTVGTSTAEEDDILKLKAGGHDPKKRGFTIQQVELAATGAIDPYVRAYIDMVLLIDEEGETVIELEEAFMVTQTLPYGLQLKVGQFFTAVGLHNSHPHVWQFVDQPVVYSRFFGADGLRNPGMQLSWVMPLPWYSELIVSGQNANGETAFSFLSSEEEEEFAGHEFVERNVESLRDILYNVRWVNTLPWGENVTLQTGGSFLYGPNATGNSADTVIYGADFVVKWKPRENNAGYPFVIWQSEILYRRYQAEAGDQIAVDEFLDDWGLYTQLVWGFMPRWTVGARYEFARGDQGEAARDFLRDERHRVSLAVTHFFSEFFKARLQYDWDKSQDVENNSPQHSVWLQFEFLLGTHAAHRFY